MTEENKGVPIEHIGDGVYASFDGYYIWLRVNSHESAPLVAIEPSVLRHLNEYAAKINETFGFDFFPMPKS